jgi:HlyD family secretion protein
MNIESMDLQGLAVARPVEKGSEGRGSGELPLPPVRWFSRYLFPLGLLTGFLGLLAYAIGDQLLPLPEVAVMNVVVQPADQVVVGATLFQAPGWVEPRPTLVNVASLTDGILEELLVVEGEYVSKGQVLARLITADMELELERVENLMAIRQSEVNRSRAEREGLAQKYQQPVHLENSLAEARSELAKVRTQRSQIPYLIQSMEARVKFAQQNWEGKKATQGTLAQRLIDQAEQEYHSLAAELAELQQRGRYLDQEIAALQQRETALERKLELRVDELRMWNEAKARVESAEALLEEAGLQRRQVQLRRQRAEIIAPMNGRILRLLAAPGSSVSDAGIHGSSTIAEMYDPENLQVRADVRLEDVPKIVTGQPVEVRTAAAGRPIEGFVSHLTSVANVQRNTLEVKVRLVDPPETVKPEMLVTNTFLGTAAETGEGLSQGDSESRRHSIFVPDRLLVQRQEGPAIWVVDGAGRAQLQGVAVERATGSGLLEIKSGLKITDKLITSNTERLKSGQRVRISGFDQVLGQQP